MRSQVHDPSYWLVLAGALLGAAAFLWLSVTLILEVFTGHGSLARNILRVVLAVGSLILGFFFITVGTLYRRSFHEDRSNRFQ